IYDLFLVSFYSLFVCFCVYTSYSFFFFFQAEDGIRDRNVTGVQTCALPISVVSASEVPYPANAGFLSPYPAPLSSAFAWNGTLPYLFQGQASAAYRVHGLSFAGSP